MFEGDHNSRRPEFFFDSVSIFFHNTLLVDEDKDLVGHILKQTTPKPAPTKLQTQPSNDDLENDLLQQALLLSMQECASLSPPPLLSVSLTLRRRVQPVPDLAKHESKAELKLESPTAKPPTHQRKLSFSEDTERNAIKQAAAAVAGAPVTAPAAGAAPAAADSGKSAELNGVARRKSSKSPDKERAKRISTLSPERGGAEERDVGTPPAASSLEKRATWGGFLRAISPGRSRDSDVIPAAAPKLEKRNTTKDDKRR